MSEGVSERVSEGVQYLKHASNDLKFGGLPVHTTDCFNSLVLQQVIRFPFKYAPWFLYASNNSFLNKKFNKWVS